MNNNQQMLIKLTKLLENEKKDFDAICADYEILQFNAKATKADYDAIKIKLANKLDRIKKINKMLEKLSK